MIDAKTKFFCVIGDPIEHSLSPIMHNAVFRHLKLNYAYLAFKVQQSSLGSAIDAFKSLDFKGVNVTIPHKVNVIKFLDELSEEAEIIGAVNTIKFGEKTIGYNTDGYGALKALKENGSDPKNKNVLILGSGGAARAISVSLGLKGNAASLSILGIVESELKKLAEDVGKTGANCSAKVLNNENLKKEIEKSDILIQCTPVGMHPKTDETIAAKELLRKDLVVFDIVYNPLETKLLKEAKKAGAKTIGGIDMFINQGAEALRIWLGIEPPLEIMKRAVLDYIKPASKSSLN